MTQSQARSARVALVTGGSRGIGRESAVRLAAEGCAIAVVHASASAAAGQVVKDITSGNGQAIAIQADVDVGDGSAVEAAFARTEEAFGGIDVVVNAAGIAPRSSVASLGLDDLDRIYRSNIRGAFAVSQQAARRLPEGKGRRRHRPGGGQLAVRTPGDSGGHRGGGRVPRRAGPLGQRSGRLRQRRRRLNRRTRR